MSSSQESTENKETNQPENVEQESEVDKVNKKNENPNLNNILIFNTIYYVIVFVLLGLPIWIFTTTTYRASLPFDEIDEISSNKKLDFLVNIQFIHFNDQFPAKFQNAFLDEINKDQSLNSYLNFNFNLNTRKATKQELDLATNAKSIESLDDSISLSSVNELKVFVLDDALAQKFDLKSDVDYVFLNSLFMNEKILQTPGKIARFIKAEYIRAQELSKNYDSKVDVQRKLQVNKDLKIVNFDSEYEITFSLVNEKPEVLNSNWNIDHCVEKYFKRIINQLSVYTNFSIKSQTLLYSDFDTYSVANKEVDGKKEYHLKTSDLSIMTNHIENRLGSRISDSSALEFVTYIPSKQPMYIVSENESKVNSFLVPRWGGIFIYNQLDSSKSIENDSAMKIFLTQFLDLIGINLNKNNKNIVRSRIYSTEIYKYLLTKTLENLLNSINTLKSLSLLLTKISSMVIEDDIAKQVHLSVFSVKKSLVLAQQGKIDEAFLFSKTAFVSSEKAFFDASLLEKLYFPEDQRFAIYIPLFIPVGIPLVLSLKTIMTWFKAKRNNLKQKTE